MGEPDRPAGGLDAAVRRTRGVQPWRRVFHAACGLAAVAFVEYGGFGPAVDLLVFSAALLASLILDWIRLSHPDTNIVFFRWFAALASPREARRIASSTWYLSGVVVVLLVAPAPYFAPAVLVLALADPAASVVGRMWGRHPLGKGSWEGTITFFLVAYALILPFAGPAAALLAAGTVACLEVLPTGVDDNLIVPVAVAMALWLIEAAGSTVPGM